ncbi:hypothetical protein [Actinomadura xylanilytica]|uniref:hypothetical protein n=1 Tax=Actinomadura xylanilytica TaxID=887459 RepID=UPI00255A8A94|nr:hypothetical protein [Actinomadura xylanilytica]MDL4770738.1 hypothetical protein [Actinomadura xylanilytica]
MIWDDYQGVRLPRSAEEGPHDTRNGLALGFSRTPRGALLAAIHISVRANALWGSGVSEPTINEQVVGPGVDALLASTRSVYDQQREPAPVPERASVVIEGFRWLGYTPDTANLDLVSAGPGDSDSTVRAATRIGVQWREGDWRAVAPLGGGWGGSAYPVESLDGFIRFPQGGR